MSKSILIIDDEPDIRTLLKYNLEKEGFKVIETDNGTDGIDIARNSAPDLILLDVMMPDMDGIETCEKIKALPNLNRDIDLFPYRKR
jgi:two-component system alkaline phosphatase synthesis response regulator PhoP